MGRFVVGRSSFAGRAGLVAEIRLQKLIADFRLQIAEVKAPDLHGFSNLQSAICNHQFLRRFDQLHLAVAGAVQDHQLAFGIAEHENIAGRGSAPL